MVKAILRPRYVLLALALVLLAVFPYMHNWPFFDGYLSDFRTFQATRFAIWLIILMGLNLLTGYSGQISLGHAAFVTIGAYAAAIMMNEWGTPVFLAVLLAGLITGLIGFLFGIPALRLSGPYLAIATLALVIALPQVLKHDLVDQWTGGVMGISLSSPQVPNGAASNLNIDQWLYYNCMIAAIVMTGVAWSLTRSRLGRAFVALRDSEIGAQQMGIHVSLYKMTAFGISSLYAGVGGALYIYTQSYLGPSTFDINASLTMLVMVVLGGLASIVGSIFAALIMTARIDLTDFIVSLVPFGDKIGIESSRGAIFGLLLILSIIFTPRGVAGSIRHAREANIGGRLRALFTKRERRAREEEAEVLSK